MIAIRSLAGAESVNSKLVPTDDLPAETAVACGETRKRVLVICAPNNNKCRAQEQGVFVTATILVALVVLPSASALLTVTG